MVWRVQHHVEQWRLGRRSKARSDAGTFSRSRACAHEDTGSEDELETAMNSRRSDAVSLALVSGKICPTTSKKLESACVTALLREPDSDSHVAYYTTRE